MMTHSKNSTCCSIKHLNTYLCRLLLRNYWFEQDVQLYLFFCLVQSFSFVFGLDHLSAPKHQICPVIITFHYVTWICDEQVQRYSHVINPIF